MKKLDKGTLYILMKHIVSNSIIFLFGTLFILYTVFYRNFAELHLQLPFLNFPIFIGEIVLFISLLLSAIYFKDYLFKINVNTYLLCVYFCFVLIKALYGYFIWGPLAFRNAAMFYYVLFAVLTYMVIPKLTIKPGFFIILITIGLIVAAIIMKLIMPYFLIYYLTFLIISLIYFGHNRVISCSVILVFILLSYFILSTNCRAVMVSYFTSVIFFLICFILFFLKSIRAKFVIAFFVIGIMGSFLYFRSDKNAVLSLLPIKEHFESFKKTKERVLKLSNTYQKKEFDLKIYEKESRVKVQEKQIDGEKVNYVVYEPGQEKKEGKLNADIKPKTELRNINIAKNNLLWRMFVVTDMLEEVAKNRRIFGMDFGKPFRSKTVEMLGWADGWWVGWIEPHNSFVHIIYRAGVLGMLFVATIIFIFVKMIIEFIKLNNLKGLILMSTILYWLLMANFMVILELPYFAIPFWIFVGATLSYYNGVKRGLKNNL